ALSAARSSSDARVREAAGTASEGRAPMAQHLAGVPSLMDRYARAGVPARAIIHAAMDARRLGHGEWLLAELLHRAAPAYLDPREHREHLLDQDWFTRALDQLTEPHIAKTRLLYPGPAVPGQTREGQLRLDDYLDQHARRVRSHLVPPGGFWEAALQ